MQQYCLLLSLKASSVVCQVIQTKQFHAFLLRRQALALAHNAYTWFYRTLALRHIVHAVQYLFTVLLPNPFFPISIASYCCCGHDWLINLPTSCGNVMISQVTPGAYMHSTRSTTQEPYSAQTISTHKFYM